MANDIENGYTSSAYNQIGKYGIFSGGQILSVGIKKD